jgi:hypothetical protein
MLDSKLILLAVTAGILFKLYDEIVDVKEIRDLVDPATTELIKASIIGIVTVFSLHDISFVIMIAIASTVFYLSDIYAYNESVPKDHRAIDNPFWYSGILYVFLMLFLRPLSDYSVFLDLTDSKNQVLYGTLTVGLIASTIESYICPEEISKVKMIIRGLASVGFFVAIYLAFQVFDTYDGLKLSIIIGAMYFITSFVIKQGLLIYGKATHEESYLLETIYKSLKE